MSTAAKARAKSRDYICSPTCIKGLKDLSSVCCFSVCALGGRWIARCARTHTRHWDMGVWSVALILVPNMQPHFLNVKNYLWERESVGSLSEFLKKMEPGQVKVRSWELNPGLQHEWKEPKYLSHHCYLPRSTVKQNWSWELELKIEPRFLCGVCTSKPPEKHHTQVGMLYASMPAMCPALCPVHIVSICPPHSRTRISVIKYWVTVLEARANHSFTVLHLLSTIVSPLSTGYASHNYNFLLTLKHVSLCTTRRGLLFSNF